MKKIFHNLLYLLCFYSFASMSATDKGLDIDELIDLPIEELVQVSIATGKKQSLAKAPSITSVITAEDIEAAGAVDIDDVLEMVPGLHVARSSTYNSIYAIRGIYATNNPQVLVLINGIPINTLYSGNHGVAWGGMPVNGIAQVEIIRGPGSALFGSDAFSGVINIITKNKSDIKGTEVGARIGRFNSRDGWLLHGDSHRGVDIAVTIEHHETNGAPHLIDQDAQTPVDNRFGTNVSHAPGTVNLAKKNLDIRTELSYHGWKLRTGYQRRDKQGLGAGLSEALDPEGYVSDGRFSADLTYRDPALTKNWDISAQISYLQNDMRLDTILSHPGTSENVYPRMSILNREISEHRLSADFTGFYTGWTNHSIRFGLGYTYASLNKYSEQIGFIRNPTQEMRNNAVNFVDVTGTKYASLTPHQRENYHAFAQDVYAFAPDWEFTTGLRYDYYSDFNSTVNPRFALVWQTWNNLTTKLLYGQAFRSPSLTELYARHDLNALGNPNLKAEVINTLELGADYYLNDRMNFSLNIYRYRWRNAIQFVSQGNGMGMAQNIGTQRGHGFELEGRWQVSNTLKLIGNYSQQYSENVAGYESGYAPSHEVYLRADWLFRPQWSLSAQLNWIADRERTADDPRENLENYTVADLTLRYKSKKHWSAVVGVHNLFDVDAREPSSSPTQEGIISIPNDLPVAKRDYFLELRYEF